MTEVRLTHVGGPTVLIEVGAWRLLTDPTFDRPGRRYSFGWGGFSRKLTGPAIAAEDIGPIDAVLLTHDHPPVTLAPAPATRRAREPPRQVARTPLQRNSANSG